MRCASTLAGMSFGSWKSVKMGAAGKSSAIAASTFSPPRQVMSQSWTRATRARRSASGTTTAGSTFETRLARRSCVR